MWKGLKLRCNNQSEWWEASAAPEGADDAALCRRRDTRMALTFSSSSRDWRQQSQNSLSCFPHLFPQEQPKTGSARNYQWSLTWPPKAKLMTTGNFPWAVHRVLLRDHEICGCHLNISSWDLGLCFLFSRVNYCITAYFRPRDTKRRFSHLRKGSTA